MEIEVAVETGPRSGEPAPETTSVLVAICTHNRTEQLRRALSSLVRQTRAPAGILVVDNAPDDESTGAMVREEFPSVRYVREPTPGLDFARNRALVESAEAIVAFLDDDAVADPGWVGATDDVFRESERIVICTGRVEALFLETEGQRLFEANGGFARGGDRIHLPRDGANRPLIARSIGVGSGCSFAVRRQPILDLGGFDIALDMGHVLPGGGDLDLLWRTLDAGYDVVYEPAVRARHEHRREREAALRQILEHNRSLIAVLTKALFTSSASRRPGVLLFLVWRLVKPGVRLLRRAVGRDPLPASALVRLWWACWRGLLTYPAANRVARARARETGR